MLVYRLSKMAGDLSCQKFSLGGSTGFFALPSLFHLSCKLAESLGKRWTLPIRHQWRLSKSPTAKYRNTRSVTGLPFPNKLGFVVSRSFLEWAITPRGGNAADCPGLSHPLLQSTAMGDAAPAEPPEPRAARCHLFNSSMRSVASRLRTFQQWPRTAPVSARDLVDAGFFYIGPGDEVQCFCCGGVLKDWRPGDCPLIEHMHFFPSCKYIRGENAGNQEMLSLQEIFDTVDGQFLSVLQGIVSEETAMPNEPEYPEMVTEEMRLSTFESWPPNSSMHPEQLARAGFFYTGRYSGEMFLTLIWVDFWKLHCCFYKYLCTCIVVKNHILPSACAVSLAACAEFVSTFNSFFGTGGPLVNTSLPAGEEQVMCFKQVFTDRKMCALRSIECIYSLHFWKDLRILLGVSCFG